MRWGLVPWCRSPSRASARGKDAGRRRGRDLDVAVRNCVSGRERLAARFVGGVAGNGGSFRAGQRGMISASGVYSMLKKRRSDSLLPTVLAAVLMSGDCTSSSKSLAGSGGAGGTADASTSDDGPDDDGSVDAPGDGGTSDKPSFCPKSITEFCRAADTTFCVPTWTEAVAPSSSCGTGITVAWQLTCDGYNVRELSTGGEVTWDQYYDLSTGALVAITIDHGRGCTAGPADFVPPACHGASVLIQRQCSDGGVD